MDDVHFLAAMEDLSRPDKVLLRPKWIREGQDAWRRANWKTLNERLAAINPIANPIAAAVRPGRKKRDDLQDVYLKTKSMMDEIMLAERDILPSEPPAAPEKTEAERAWDYLVLAAEASRYNT